MHEEGDHATKNQMTGLLLQGDGLEERLEQWECILHDQHGRLLLQRLANGPLPHHYFAQIRRKEEVPPPFEPTHVEKAQLQNPPPRDWDIENLRTVLDSWPDELPAVFVNFDHHDERAPFLEQVKAARRLFRKYPGHLHLFLIKPETKEQTTLNEVIKVVIANVGELTSFDIVGVTEKEL